VKREEFVKEMVRMGRELLQEKQPRHKAPTLKPGWKPIVRECSHGSSYLPHAEKVDGVWYLWLRSTCNEAEWERCPDVEDLGGEAWPFVEDDANPGDLIMQGYEVA
jgi:hypothetical protein